MPDMSSRDVKEAAHQQVSADTMARSPGVRAATAELLSLLFCVELIMWVVPVLPGGRAAYGALALVIAVLLTVCYIKDGLDLPQVGIRVDNLGTALARLSIPLTAFVLLVVLIGLVAGSLKLGQRFLSMLIVVPLWALLQQYMLLAFAGTRLRVIVGPGKRSVLATAALFGFLHLPNPTLAVACIFGGYIWATVYDRYPNLIAGSLTHAVASAFLANSLPHSLLKNMVVGYNYFFR
jgi:hypothetical protein